VAITFTLGFPETTILEVKSPSILSVAVAPASIYVVFWLMLIVVSPNTVIAGAVMSLIE
jgi:hypothetical protein